MKNLLQSCLSFILIFLSTTFSNPLQSQVTVDTTLTVEQLVNDVLLGEGISATNITFNGEPADNITFQAGSFGVDSSAFPIAQGVVMATGKVTGIAGGDDFSWDNALQDDPDLVAIGGQNMNNCAVIEFDFVATTDTFLIDYVFASTEYPGYTCSNFNDAFGVFISGPGCNGPFTDNAENIALIPNSDTPVAINTVNGGFPTGGGTEQNCLDANPNYVHDSIYFFNNDPAMENSIAYPGHTHMFTAFASLEPGSQYHFKFALGNAVDQALQSAVLMRSGSVSSGLVESELQIQVDTEGYEISEDGVYIAGTFNYFVPEPMEQIGPDVYKFSTQQPANVNITYKFFNGADPNAAELVPDSCSIDGMMSGGNRFVATGDEPITLESVCFGECGSCIIPLATNDVEKNDLKFYPNPSEGEFQVLAPATGFAGIQAFDTQGKMVLNKRVYLNQGEAYAFSLPTRGLYKVRFYFEDNQVQAFTGTVIVN